MKIKNRFFEQKTKKCEKIFKKVLQNEKKCVIIPIVYNVSWSGFEDPLLNFAI